VRARVRVRVSVKICRKCKTVERTLSACAACGAQRARHVRKAYLTHMHSLTHSLSHTHAVEQGDLRGNLRGDRCHAGARDSSRQLGRLPPRARQHADAHLLCECPVIFFLPNQLPPHLAVPHVVFSLVKRGGGLGEKRPNTGQKRLTTGKQRPATGPK
jgi:hypothetical protein